jgi:urea transport system permease protein
MTGSTTYAITGRAAVALRRRRSMRDMDRSLFARSSLRSSSGAGAVPRGAPESSPFHLSAYFVTLIGKIMCYCVVAIAMNLIWGYTGILSLGHGVFFALGGYAFGMYLMRMIGARGPVPERPAGLHGVPRLEGIPWYWSESRIHFWYSALLVVLVPGLLAFVFGYFAFRSRIKGVYFSIITQALTFAVHAALLPQRHGLRRQQRLHGLQAVLGFRDRRSGDRATLFALITGCCAAAA